MRSEKLDKRITFESFTDSKDSYGQEIRTWSTFASCWAGIKLNIGKEAYISSEKVKERVVDFKIRWREDLNNEMRIIYKSNYYDIQDIIELGREDGLIIRGQRLWQT